MIADARPGPAVLRPQAVVTLILLGRSLEAQAKRRTGAAELNAEGLAAFSDFLHLRVKVANAKRQDSTAGVTQNRPSKTFG